jgi:hypothetical protein
MKRVSHTYVQTNNAAPERVFPLLCPVREAEWVPDWQYHLMYSQTGVAEVGCVFTTPNDNNSKTTWIVTSYEPMRRIAFAWFWPEMIATRLNIELELLGTDRTSARITYEYTALTDAGERELERYDEAWYAAKMKGWESAINHYLQTGHMINGHNRE